MNRAPKAWRSAILAAVSAALTTVPLLADVAPLLAAPDTAPTATTMAPTTAPTVARPDPRIEGLWVWKSKYITDADERRKLLEFCQRQGFNRLLVQVPWKPGTSQVVHSPPSERDAPTDAAIHPVIAFPVDFTQLITDAAKQHVVVEALDGTPYMGDKANWPATLATVDAILAFNASLPAGARFVGIHWDIEPYVRADWKVQATRGPIEVEYLQMLTEARRKLREAGSDVTLSVDIPMWYDNKTAPDDNCTVTFNGQTKNFHEHIQDLTDYVGIMSYRQHALGRNSAAEHVASELAYAEKIGKFICPAFETVPLTATPQITFFGKSAEMLQTQRHALEGALGDRPGFGGMFVHCYPAVVAVLEPATPVK